MKKIFVSKKKKERMLLEVDASMKSICQAAEADRDKYVAQFEEFKEAVDAKMANLENIKDFKREEVEHLVDLATDLATDLQFCDFMYETFKDYESERTQATKKAFKIADDYFGSRYAVESMKVYIANKEVMCKVKHGYRNLSIDVAKAFLNFVVRVGTAMPGVDLHAAVIERFKLDDEMYAEEKAAGEKEMEEIKKSMKNMK